MTDITENEIIEILDKIAHGWERKTIYDGQFRNVAKAIMDKIKEKEKEEENPYILHGEELKRTEEIRGKGYK